MTTLADLNNEEFDQMLENMSKPDYDALTSDEFFKILAAMNTTHTIELSAHIKNGQLVFEQPAPLPVELNAILIGNKRIVIKLQPGC